MIKLIKWRITPAKNGEFILTGVTRYGHKIEQKISGKNIKQARLNTSYLRTYVDVGFGYELWFKDADLSMPITPMRRMKIIPQRDVLSAAYCLMAEVSMVLCGFSKEVDKDYLKTEKSVGVFFNDDPADEYGFDLDIAIKLLLQAGGVE